MILETDPSVRVEMVKLLDREGQRAGEIAQRELENGLEIVQADVAAIRTGNWAGLFATLLASLQKFGNWMAMTAFAGFLAFFLVKFLGNRDYTGAGHLKDILMVMLGGALGWISKDRQPRAKPAKADGKEPNLPSP